MKHAVSVSLSEDTILKIREKIRHNSIYRNKSHFIEQAIERLMEDE